jgi:hypothetical protein
MAAKKYGLAHNYRETYTNPEKVIFRSYTNPYILQSKYFPEEGLPDGSPEHPEYNALGKMG